MGSGESFVHLHVHTEFSMLDGASRISELFDKCARDGMPAVATTDHGNLFGLPEFFQTGQKTGVKPILGMEAYLAHGSRRDQSRTPMGDRYYHLTTLAMDDTGYHNLVQLSTRAYLEGYWYKPRIDYELLDEHNEGLIVLSGCLGGEVNQYLMQGDEGKAKESLAKMRDIFGPERFYVEQMDHGIPEQSRNWPRLEAMAKDLGLRTVITNDSHYTEASDAEAHDALLCIQTGSRISDTDRFKFSGPEYYVRTAQEMWNQFGSTAPDALRATLDIAEMCNAKLEFGLDLLPQFPCPDGMSEGEYLREKVYAGARRLYGDPVPTAARERIDYELSVIEQMGFPAYFLIVADLCDYAREAGIRVGPGRGSAGGSAVAYCTGITQVDPIKYGLIFERFLNPARIQMPDIDMDFDDRRRSEMIRYAAERYGEDHVAQIITFGTIKAKSAIRDAARVLDYPFAVGDKLCKAMPPPVQGKEPPLEKAFEQSTELRDAYDSDPDSRRVLDTAKTLEGLKRQHGIHAAAVIIGAKPLTETVPLLRTDKGETLTQFEMGACEAIGLLKMDFLGLRNLTVISDAERHIQKNRGREVHLDDPAFLGDMDDPAVYEELSTGHTLGVFQLDSTGMQALVRKLRPTRFEDISALLALYRPGPLGMDMHIAFANRKNGFEDVTYDHPDLEPILGETYGVCVSGDTIVTDVESGERIRVADAEGRSFLVQGAHGEVGKVSHWVDNGEKDVIRLTIRNGREITLTPDHRVLTPTGWRPAGELAPGDAVATPHRLEVDGRPTDPHELKVLAYLLADGSIPARVPDEVFAADDEGIATFLAAYWDCDGHVSPDVAYVETISATLARDLQDLLLRLGIASRVSSYAQADRRDGRAYRVHVYDGPAFAPIRSRMLTAKRDVAFDAEPSDVDLDLRDRFELIERVEPAGHTRVYDLTVDGIHSFVADGVVVHNCVYQEQVMKIATDVAGFTMADADGLRKAVGKKKLDLMMSMETQFKEGGTEKGYEAGLMKGLWDMIVKFAEYGFNKSHTVAYGVVSYQTAWLKTHYPVEYMAALLTSVKNNKDTKPIYLNECRRMGIPVLPPNVNESESDFTPRGDEILFGLAAVRGVGDGLVGDIVEARERQGKFTDFRDFCDKVDAGVLNKRTIENLILAGAFTELGHTRKGLLEAYEPIVEAALARKKAEAAGQFSLFDGALGDADDEGVELDDGVEITDTEFDKQRLLKFEREMLGLYVSDHPLFGAERLLESYVDSSCADLREKEDGAGVTIAGVLTGLTKKFTKKGDTYLIATLEDLSGSVEVVFWPATYRAAHEALVEDAVLVVTGRLEVRDEAVKMTANKVSAPDLSEVLGAPVVVRFAAEQCTAAAVQRLKEILSHHEGHVPVHLQVDDGAGGSRVYRLGDDHRVSRQSGLYGEVKAAFGPDAITEQGGVRTFGSDEDEPRWRRPA